MKPRSRLLFSLMAALVMLACSLGAIPATPSPEAPATFAPTVVQVLTEPGATPATSSTDNSGPLNPGTLTGCTPRSDWPIYVVQRGDTLSLIAARANTTQEALQRANCLASPDVIFTGDQLHVPALVVLTPPALVASAMPGCDAAWFFHFTTSIPESSTCPGLVYNTPAAGEDFEGGRAYYYAPIGAVLGPLVYVIYNDGSWEQYSDRFNGNVEAPSDPTIIPPPGRYQPVRAIGKVWRENPTVRAKLGWAYTPESDFAGRRQFANGSSIVFIDHGAHGLVLRLDNTSQRWLVAGSY